MINSVVWILIFMNLCLNVFSQLEAPQNVKLISENFRYIVTWKPGAESPPDTRYTVEACNLNAKGIFTPVKKCTNITKLSCDLSQRFRSFSSLYWVRVKSVTNQTESTWMESNELLPNRDTILGPPIIHVKNNIQTIEVMLDMPLTPHKQGDNKLKILKDIDPHLIYIVILFDKNGKHYMDAKIEPDKLGKGYYLFKNLKPNFTYCVVARFESLLNIHLKDSKKICLTISPQNTDIMWIAPLIAAAVFILGVIGAGFMICILKEFTYLHLVQTPLPKSLVIISQDLHVNLQCQELDENPEDDHISFITQDDHSSDYYRRSQRVELAASFTDDMNEHLCYQSNGLKCEGYECNSLLQRKDSCSDSDNVRLPSSLQPPTENKGCANYTQNLSPGDPASFHLQYQKFSGVQNTNKASSNNSTEEAAAPEAVHHFGTVQEIKMEITDVEFWNCSDVPLSSVKLSINDNAEKDDLEVDSCADGTSDHLSDDGLCTLSTSHLAATINPPQNDIQVYQERSINLPQSADNCSFQNMIPNLCTQIYEPTWMKHFGYEAQNLKKS
ncbi:interleukin-10 receptor subunit beta-like [Hypanus sabinus]|uniref:interleukin-10 receptor subunit beta-like n=1 Tax=Hypanus sabinus TaxID=79690 RepID=UPI0028C39258|nr:interleukin-10 receptor subunit beta-like [Hypanus sabinus]